MPAFLIVDGGPGPTFEDQQLQTGAISVPSGGTVALDSLVATAAAGDAVGGGLRRADTAERRHHLPMAIQRAKPPRATSPLLVISNASAANAGTYVCIATNASGSTASNPATVAIATSPAALANPGRLINLSVLSNIQGSLGMGFVNGGAGTSGLQSLLVRGIGPSIGPGTLFNIPGVMPDPSLTVTQQSNQTAVATNTGWGTLSGNAAAVMAADSATGAFALTNTSSLDSAVVVNCPEWGEGIPPLSLAEQIGGQRVRPHRSLR